MSIGAFTFTTPTRIVAAWGAATDGTLAKEAARLGKRPLLVVGSSLTKNGVAETLMESLRAAGLQPTLYTGIPPEPDLVALQACTDAVVAADADSVLAIGGGSVLDVAKGAAALAGTGHSVQEYFDGKLPVPEAINRPILAAPTTAGTGSEVTWVGVYSDKAANRKASIRGSAMMPAITVLDAQLTVSCPRAVTVHSGMDAFVQALESFTSLGANPLTDSLALEAARLTSYHKLITLTQTPDDRAAREAMALGSLMAGQALNTSRLGLVHGLAHPIGALTGAAHGLLCALLLVPVMRFNREAAATKYAVIARELLGEQVAGKSDLDAADTLIATLDQQLSQTLAVPRRLRDIGLSESDFARVASESMSSGSTKANPRPVTLTDAQTVLESCY